MNVFKKIEKNYIFDDRVDKVHLITKDWRVLWIENNSVAFLLQNNLTFFFFNGTVVEFLQKTASVSGIEVDRLKTEIPTMWKECQECKGFGYLDWLDKLRGEGRFRNDIDLDPSPIYVYYSNSLSNLLLVRRNMNLKEPEFTLCSKCFGCGLTGVSDYHFLKILV